MTSVMCRNRQTSFYAWNGLGNERKGRSKWFNLTEISVKLLLCLVPSQVECGEAAKSLRILVEPQCSVCVVAAF